MNDPHHLQRFLDAQSATYESALSEIKSGRKRTHWMWFIFPQIFGLGFSATSQLYAIKSRDEAAAYLAHPTLGPRILECSQATLEVQNRSAYEIFGSPDDGKLKSSMTLFAAISPVPEVFQQVLGKYYDGRTDQKTLDILEKL